MRIVPFPQPEGLPDPQTLAEIEAALHDNVAGPHAESWRELRADVRSLAPVISPDFEQRLREGIEARSAAAAPYPRPRRAHGPRAKLRGWLAASTRNRAVALAGVFAASALAALVIAAPWRGISGAGQIADFAPSSGALSPNSQLQSAKHHSYKELSKSLPDVVSTSSAEASSATSSQGTAESAAESATERVQQRAATLTLAPKPESVQSVADEVAQLAVRDGGFVQSSQVRQQHGAGASAELRLSLPSARLSAALASLARLAPTRAESQSLQDITDEYDVARSKLADAVAERQALLHALARASTQSEIESLHERIALAAAAVTRDRSAFQVVSQRGSNSTVEVTVLGDAHAADAARSTLSQGLHDALVVLKIALVVLLVALAVLVPLAVVVLLIAFSVRASRRYLRERALS
ncbi:MAG TPA: DUF4349 domain-containing protein [Solirubrobacteraceae bacterium]|jgi:hypothetical protein